MRKLSTLVTIFLFLNHGLSAQTLPDIYTWNNIEQGISSKMMLNHFAVKLFLFYRTRMQRSLLIFMYQKTFSIR